MAGIEERMLELAREALTEQERHVADMRTRAATVLAAGGVVGGLLGREIFNRGHPHGFLEWSCAIAGIAAAGMLVASVTALFVLRQLAFSMDARATYAWFFNNGITAQPLVDLEIADRLAQTRDENDGAVQGLRRSLHCALGSLVVMAATLATGAALAS